MASLYEGSETLIPLHDMHWNAEQHTIIIKKRSIALTIKEFQLLFPLRDGSPITYANLAAIVYQCSMDDKVRTMLDKHIDRIRGKLRGTGIYVYCILGYGYMLLPEKLSEQCA